MRIQRIDGGIDAEFGDLARQHRGRIQMRERSRRRGIGQIVGRNVNRLHRSDRAFVGRRDAFLQRAHVGGEGRLITDRRRNAAQQRRNFRTGLREAENVIDEEQNVLSFFVAEIFGERQAGQRQRARARRAVRSSGRTPARLWSRGRRS